MHCIHYPPPKCSVTKGRKTPLILIITKSGFVYIIIGNGVESTPTSGSII